MAQPQLHAWYSAEQVISFFGEPAEAQQLCNGQWLIFAADAVCMTEIGKPPRDPPVFGRYEYRGRWAREQTTLSEHLILTCLFEAVMCHANYGASIAWLEEEKFAAIIHHIPPLAIPPWRWVGMRFFAGKGAFMYAAENGVGKPYGRKSNRRGATRYYSVHIGAKTETPLQFLKPLIDDKWDYVDL